MQHLEQPKLGKQKKSAFPGVQHEKGDSDYGLEALGEGSACSGLAALRVLGDAMAPRILDGDIALVAREATVENGGIAAVSVDGNWAEICRLLWQGGGVLMCPQNLQYPMRFFSKKEAGRLCILGKVVKTIRNL